MKVNLKALRKSPRFHQAGVQVLIDSLQLRRRPIRHQRRDRNSRVSFRSRSKEDFKSINPKKPSSISIIFESTSSQSLCNFIRSYRRIRVVELIVVVASRLCRIESTNKSSAARTHHRSDASESIAVEAPTSNAATNHKFFDNVHLATVNDVDSLSIRA